MRPVAVLMGAALALGGCGVSTDAADAPQERTVEQETSGTATAPQRQAPERPDGLVEIAGPARDEALTPQAIERFRPPAGRATRVTYSGGGSTAGFRALCAGRADIVETTRRLTRAEAEACRANGLEVVREFRVASDAIIVATKNQSDVGGDCLSVLDVRNVFRRGSDISNWSALGFDDLPLRTTGPTPEDPLFAFFSQRVLDEPSRASLGVVRSDYREQETDRAIRNEVIGRKRFLEARASARRRIARLRRRESDAEQRVVDRAVAAADRAALREVDRINDRNRRLGITVDPVALAQSNARLVERRKRAAERRARRTFRRTQDVRVRRAVEPLLEEALRPGSVGLFSFSYYTQFEEQLRPMEIDPYDGTGARRSPQCIFPSENTIPTGEYPLSQAFLLYTTRTSLARREVKDFLTQYLAFARAIAIENQLVPIPQALRNDQIETVTGRELQRRVGAGLGPTGPTGPSGPSGPTGAPIPGVATP